MNTKKHASEIYELIPENGRKSFYGKAKVIVCGMNGWKFLRSYDTIVCGIDAKGDVHRYSDHKSATTCSHCKSFVGNVRYDGFWKLPIEKQPTIVVEL